MNQSYEHTAIPTWSGFVYQGKVALYHVIKLLVDDNTCQYSLQLDYGEDFNILDGQSQIISLHQVKAYKECLLSAYGDAFMKLQAKANSSTKTYFHKANSITDKTDEAIERDFSPVKIYEYYDGNKMCGVDEIDAKIEGVVKQYFNKYQSGESWRISEKYLNLSKTFLCGIIENKVLEIHAEGQRTNNASSTACKAKIKFDEILEMLTKELNERDTMYYLYKTRQSLGKYYNEFVAEKTRNSEINGLSKLLEYMIQIERFNEKEIKAFIQNIMPHRDFKLNCLDEFKDNNIVADEVKQAFFQILYELKDGVFKKENIVWDACRHSYYPTTIHHGSRIEQIERVCSQIVTNAHEKDFGLLYDKECLITLNIDVPSIADGAKNIMNINSVDASHIMKWKKVSLVSLDKAKGKINA